MALGTVFVGVGERLFFHPWPGVISRVNLETASASMSTSQQGSSPAMFLSFFDVSEFNVSSCLRTIALTMVASSCGGPRPKTRSAVPSSSPLHAYSPLNERSLVCANNTTKFDAGWESKA